MAMKSSGMCRSQSKSLCSSQSGPQRRRTRRRPSFLPMGEEVSCMGVISHSSRLAAAILDHLRQLAVSLPLLRVDKGNRVAVSS